MFRGRRGGLQPISPSCRSFCKRLPKLAVNILLSSVRRRRNRYATAATCELCFGYGRTCSLRLGLHVETKKKATIGDIGGQQRRANVSPAVSVLKKKEAVIGRAAAHRSSKKLDRLCDHSLMRDEARLARLAFAFPPLTNRLRDSPHVLTSPP